MAFPALEQNGWMKTFSDTGRSMLLPQGIFHWSGRAGKEADINATIGTACGKASDIIPGASDAFITFYLPAVVEKMKALSPEQIFPYAPIGGLPAFRNKWREWVVAKTQPHFPYDEKLLGRPLVVPGVSPALFYLADLFLSPGEAMVIPDKRWENYDHIFVNMLGIRIESYSFFDDGKPAPQNLEKKLVEVAKKQDKLVTVLNFPNNPTGYMPTRAEAEAYRDALLGAAKTTGKQIVAIFDDAYDGYVFEDDAAPISIVGMFVGLHPNIIPVKCDGVSKEFLWYGGRTAAMTFAFHPDCKDREKLEAELENKLSGLVRGTVSNCTRPVQEAVALALDDKDRIRAERATVQAVLAKRCAKLKESLKAIPDDVAYADPFNAGFFCLLNLRKTDAEKLADHLLKKHRVGTIPAVDKALGINALRLAFCGVDIAKIDTMVQAIKAGIDELG